MLRLHLARALLILAGLSSPAQSQVGPDSVTYRAINDSMIIRMLEGLTTTPPAGASDRQLTIMLAVQTVHDYPCALVVHAALTKDQLDVRVPGTLRGLACKDIVAPAFGAVALPLCNGRYRLKLWRPDGATDHYLLEVTDSTLELSTEVSTFTTAVESPHRRVRTGAARIKCHPGNWKASSHPDDT